MSTCHHPNLDQAKEELLLFLKTPVIDATVHNSIEVQVPRIQPKTKQVSEDEFSPFILGGFPVIFPQLFRGARCPVAKVQVVKLIWQATAFGTEVWYPPNRPTVEARNAHGSKKPSDTRGPIHDTYDW